MPRRRREDEVLGSSKVIHAVARQAGHGWVLELVKALAIPALFALIVGGYLLVTRDATVGMQEAIKQVAAP